MSKLECPVDADLLDQVRQGELTAAEAATYTACRRVVAIQKELIEVKKKVNGQSRGPSSIDLVSAEDYLRS